MFGLIHSVKNFISQKGQSDHYASETGNSQTGGATSSYNAYGNYQDPDHIPLRRLIQRLNRDVHFNMAVRSNSDFSVGAGFHLSGTDINTAKGQESLDLIEKYTEDINLDALVQNLAVDGWATGNAFLIYGKKDGLPRHIDPGQIVGIDSDEDGDPTYYYRQTPTNTPDKIPARDIVHFTFQRRGSWGVGLGQIMERKGLGYKNSKGKTVTKPNDFESREMCSHMTSMQIYAGSPRYMSTMDGSPAATADVGRKIASLGPLENFTSNIKNLKVQEMTLNPGKMGPLYDRIDHEAILGTMSPISSIWKTKEFSWASSRTAIEALFPMIGAFQRSLKRFIEQELFMPILQEAGLDKYKVAIAFGREDQLGLDKIGQLVSILRDEMFDGLYDPEDLLELMRDAGAPLAAKNPTKATHQLRAQTRQKRRQDTAAFSTMFRSKYSSIAQRDVSDYDKDRLMHNLTKRLNEHKQSEARKAMGG